MSTRRKSREVAPNAETPWGRDAHELMALLDDARGRALTSGEYLKACALAKKRYDAEDDAVDEEVRRLTRNVAEHKDQLQRATTALTHLSTVANSLQDKNERLGALLQRSVVAHLIPTFELLQDILTKYPVTRREEGEYERLYSETWDFSKGMDARDSPAFVPSVSEFMHRPMTREWAMLRLQTNTWSKERHRRHLKKRKRTN